MRSKLLSALALALSLPGAALAIDYPFYSSSSDGNFMFLENNGSTYKTMLQISSYVNSLGVSVGLGNSGYASTTGYQAYVYGDQESYNTSYEAWTDGQGDNTTNYGFHGTAVGREYSSNYGIWATAYNYGGTTFNAAGYFAGDVFADAYYFTSDRKFKKDIQDETGGLKTILALKPRTYSMRKDEFKGKMNFSEGKKHGFIAQELETVLPELVKDAVAPAILTKEEKDAGVKKDPTQYKSVDYVGVIPVLVAAMQEQQALIEKLTAKVAALEAGK